MKAVEPIKTDSIFSKLNSNHGRILRKIKQFFIF